MGHFAKIQNGVVTKVIVADSDFFDSFVDDSPGQWVETSYSARAGINYGKDGKPDGGVAFRKNYAGIGYSYDSQRDAFIPPKPFASWLLDESSCTWEAPVPMPSGGAHAWDEEAVSWKELSDV